MPAAWYLQDDKLETVCLFNLTSSQTCHVPKMALYTIDVNVERLVPFHCNCPDEYPIWASAFLDNGERSSI